MRITCFLLTVFLFLLCRETVAQYTADKIVGQKQKYVSLADSLKHSTYPYLLPIWGQKVISKGFDLPFPMGFSAQYVWQQSDIIINNLQVGFNNGPKRNCDDLIRFDEATATTNGVNVRPDFWLFPFLNVYGILARSNNSTAVKCGLWIPDSSSSWKKIADINTKADFDATTIGFGLTPTFGIGGFFLALDMNFSWSDIEQLDKPAYIFILGPRIGKNFKFKGEQSLAIWTGGFRVHMNSGTNGSLPLSDLFPVNEWNKRIDSGYMKVANSQQQVDAWWNGLSDRDQQNPVNKAKYNTANTALEKAGQLLDGASQAASTLGNSTVQYSLDKRPKDKWNFLIGAQYQLNKHFMARVEYGFLSSRKQLIAGLQYRFGF
ncbi:MULTISPECIES: hypothetical protein [Niastella]|uniref:Outer membrane protein beta-barrel domain-containing protein n=1 Tax=Niastella soli TaxID=2821487 RepID=A0ABS3YW20_9BACT|nr:hypothetical protein [Niastella soli]MBO9201717.1 hypothetical protein [Niastella soli]